MIEWIIRRSVANRFLVLMGALFLSIWGTWTIINTPVDALPGLSTRCIRLPWAIKYKRAHRFST